MASTKRSSPLALPVMTPHFEIIVIDALLTFQYSIQLLHIQQPAAPASLLTLLNLLLSAVARL
jgi:hypothetical protein